MNSSVATVLVVDPEQRASKVLAPILKDQCASVICATSGQEALELAREHSPTVFFVDEHLPDGDGLELLRQLARTRPSARIVITTRRARIQSAVQATKWGAYDYLEHPIDAARISQLIDDVTGSWARPGAASVQVGGAVMVGRSPPMQKLIRELELVSRSPSSTVLVQGETGTGKELIARLIHFKSIRRNKNLVDVSCATLSSPLLESELFGHTKGAFTGADRDKTGLLELAHGGTLFLDEVAEMSLGLQAKLLRVLQERRFRKVGGLESISVDVRIIASTNCFLPEAVEQGRFRRDLYYRINVFPIEVVPLRERKEDIPLLCQHFLSEISSSTGRSFLGLVDEAVAKLYEYDWPGNVRELRNVLERAAVIETGPLISSGSVWLPSADARAAASGNLLPLSDWSLRTAERALIRKVLEQTNWNKSEAAGILGITRTTLYEKISRYGIAGERSGRSGPS